MAAASSSGNKTDCYLELVDIVVNSSEKYNVYQIGILS